MKLKSLTKKSQIIKSCDTAKTLKEKKRGFESRKREAGHTWVLTDLSAKTLKEIMGWYIQGTENQIEKKYLTR